MPCVSQRKKSQLAYAKITKIDLIERVIQRQHQRMCYSIERRSKICRLSSEDSLKMPMM